jgi:hypothetical protein
MPQNMKEKRNGNLTSFQKIGVSHWRRHLYRADLPMLLLAVPSRGIRHLPTVDHEAVVDLGELSRLAILLLIVVVGSATLRRWPGLL